MPLTPEEFNKLSTKEDLILLEEKMEEKFASKEDVNNIMNALDGIAKKFDNHARTYDEPSCPRPI